MPAVPKFSDISRKIVRIGHEIVENYSDISRIVLLGIHNRGVPIAQRLKKFIKDFTDIDVPMGSLDITFHRDDFRERLTMPEIKGTDISFNLDEKIVVLVDDVLFSGRTIRAALDALGEIGRPKTVQLAVLVDRGHRQLPIKADYVGKNLPTSPTQIIKVQFTELDGVDAVSLEEGGK